MTGIDPVPRFIERAKELDERSTYLVGRAEELPIASEAFDLVLSYLTLIDIPDLATAAGEVARVLRPGGELVVVTISNIASSTPGWRKDEAGRKLHRVVDRYMEAFAMDLERRGIRVRNFHRPLPAMLGEFFSRGFVMTEFIEPLPRDRQSELYAEEVRAPNFQIFTLRKENDPRSGSA